MYLARIMLNLLRGFCKAIARQAKKNEGKWKKEAVVATESSLKTSISPSNTRRIAFACNTADHLMKNINSMNFSFLSLQQNFAKQESCPYGRKEVWSVTQNEICSRSTVQ